ncbi:hypothetical protein DFH09DRAFT_1339585 [Mycena vulgaris]|nr:hypothetical protein DFH09DRAFT_1339585 [Mycena vulgaris]
MLFLDLPEEVVCYALGLFDISSVISICQANKYLHHLAFTPTVWISLVEELWYRGIIDGIFPSDIHALSTPELIAVVKRLLLGPETWVTTQTRQMPEAAAEQNSQHSAETHLPDFRSPG